MYDCHSCCSDHHASTYAALIVDVPLSLFFGKGLSPITIIFLQLCLLLLWLLLMLICCCLVELRYCLWWHYCYCCCNCCSCCCCYSCNYNWPSVLYCVACTPWLCLRSLLNHLLDLRLKIPCQAYLRVTPCWTNCRTSLSFLL